MSGVDWVVKNLGELQGDVLLFGGPYSNLQASQAMLDIARKRGIAPQNRICTGDVIAYFADPVATLHLWRDECELVAGNCEQQLGAGADDCGCGFEDGSACDVLSKGWYAFADRAVSRDDRLFMVDAPDLVVFTQVGRRYVVIHGGLSDVAQFLWPVSAKSEFLREISLVRGAVGQVDCIIAGHCGMAFETQVDGVDWINVGVIGMPPHDGQPETRFAVLRDGCVKIETLNYDFGAVRLAMERVGLVQGYEKTLQTGFWPSEDILPRSMRH